jgi:hypothetical protein
MEDQARAAQAVGLRCELRCPRCGYGVTVRIAPERCPMCGGSAWVEVREDGAGPADRNARGSASPEPEPPGRAHQLQPRTGGRRGSQ